MCDRINDFKLSLKNCDFFRNKHAIIMMDKLKSNFKSNFLIRLAVWIYACYKVYKKSYAFRSLRGAVSALQSHTLQ